MELKRVKDCPVFKKEEIPVCEEKTIMEIYKSLEDYNNFLKGKRKNIIYLD